MNTPCWKCTTGKQSTADTLSGIGNKQMKRYNPDFFNRLDRYKTMDNGYLERPVTTLKQSNFKKLYDKYNADTEFKDNDILPILGSKNTYIGGKINLVKYYSTQMPAKCDSIPKKCIYLWSLESPLYGDLCTILETDDYNDLKLYMPLIRCMNKFIVNHPTNSSLETYRGSHMVSKQFDLLKTNGLYRITKYLATSEDKNVAKQFLSAESILITFKIPKGCYNAAKVSKYSYFSENEAEVLLPPYSVVKVIGINKKEKQLTVQVLDNKATGLDTPQIHL